MLITVKWAQILSLTLKVKTWLTTRLVLSVFSSSETLNCSGIVYACYKMKKCVPWRRLKRQRKRRESCKNCRIGMTIRCWLSSEKSNSAWRARKQRRKPWQSENWKRNNRCSSATKTSETRRWQRLRKFVDRKTKLSTICTEWERRTITMLSSANSRSVRPNLWVYKSKTISSSRRERMPGTKLTWRRQRWQIRFQRSRRRAWILKD